MVESSGKTWSTAEGNDKPLQYSCLENPMNSMKRQKDRTLKDELLWSVQFSSVTQSSLTLCDPMDYSMPGFPVYHQLSELTQIHVHRLGDVIQTPHPLSALLLLPSIFPSIRVFFSESVLHITWPKYWSFSFSIRLSNEYSGLTSLRIHWFDFLAAQGMLKVFSNTTVQKYQLFSTQLSLYFNSHIHT